MESEITLYAESAHRMEIFRDFIVENDPNRRVAMAEEIIRSSGDTLGMFYLNLSDIDVNELSENARKFTEDTRIEAQDRGRTRPLFVKEFEAYYHGVRHFERTGELDKNKPMLDLHWQWFAESLGLDDPHVDEVLNWFRQKLDKNEVLIIDSSLQRNALAQQYTAEMSQYASSRLMTVSIPESSRSVVVLCADLMNGSYTPLDFITGLAHERGHDILNNNRSVTPSDLGDTGAIFNEFFPILEEARVQHALGVADKVDKRDMETAKLPFGDIQMGYVFDETSFLLLQAYWHEIDQRRRQKAINLAIELKMRGLPKEQIDEAVSKLKIITTPVINHEK